MFIHVWTLSAESVGARITLQCNNPHYADVWGAGINPIRIFLHRSFVVQYQIAFDDFVGYTL
jgi:hypothetical protein